MWERLLGRAVLPYQAMLRVPRKPGLSDSRAPASKSSEWGFQDKDKGKLALYSPGIEEEGRDIGEEPQAAGMST